MDAPHIGLAPGQDGAVTTDQPTGPFRLRSMGLTAYGPTIVNGTGFGAMLPVLALRARELGADVSTAALVVALLGLGTLVASLPAGPWSRGSGNAGRCSWSASSRAPGCCWRRHADSVEVLGVAVVVTGMTWAVFLIARQGYMIDAVPASHRARALSGLGGSFRVGMLVGPLAGAALITRFGLSAPFVLAAVMAVVSALMALLMPDLGSVSRTEQRVSGHLSVWSVLAAHRRTLLTLGTAVVVISASRSVRFGLLPLWADQVGIPAATTSLIFAVGAAIDIACFYPGGWIMDTRGRAVVAVPVVLSAGVACLLLPLATTTARSPRWSCSWPSATASARAS